MAPHYEWRLMDDKKQEKQNILIVMRGETVNGEVRAKLGKLSILIWMEIKQVNQVLKK